MAVPAQIRIRRINTLFVLEANYGSAWVELKSIDTPGLPDKLQAALVYPGTPVATHTLTVKAEREDTPVTA